MGEQDVTAQPPPPRHTAYTAQPPARELLAVGRPLSRQAEAYLDDVLPRLEKDEYEIVFGEQGFDCVAKRSCFELAKFGFADYTIVFVEFGRLDARSLWEFSRAAFGYAAARGGMAQPGLQGGRFCFPVALISADEGAIRAVRDGAAPMHLAAFEFPCVYDLRADELHYRQRTPLFGGAYYAGTRSLAARLLSRRPCEDAIPGGATAEAVTAFSRPLVQKETLVVKTVDEQMELIRRGAEQITPEADLRRKLERSVQTGRPLRVKYGIDPTGIDVHLGHTVPLRKLRLFQELGHQAVLIIGNYTALVGDPSGRDETRARLTPEQVEANAHDYLAQVSKVIDIRRTEVTRNGDWFGKKFTFLNVLTLTSKITVQRMLERDDFTKRFRAEPSVPIYLHECLYPLMQGQDSVEIRADVELGGSEQLFNLMMGRKLQEDAGQEPQVCLTLPILRGLDGVRRMGKSLGNYVGVGEPAKEQFAKTMSIPDELMPEWFTLLTDRPADEIQRLIQSPMEAKKTLGRDIVTFYHGTDAARQAQTEWEDQFSHRKDPATIDEVQVEASNVADGKIQVTKLLVLLNLAKSNNEARRHVQGGGVTVGPEREKVTDPNAAVTITDGLVVRFGRKIVRVRLT